MILPADLTAPRAAVWLGAVIMVVNEIRGALLAVPALFMMWKTAGAAMSLWLALCTVAGVALSVLVSRWGARLGRGTKRLEP